jgi:hypothetical protein
MQFSSHVRLALVAFAAICSLVTSRSRAADPPIMPSLRLSNFENTMATINLRKLARKVLQWGDANDDNQPIWFGPARARLFWQKTWKWPESSRDHKLPGGLLGGPVLSIDMPFTQRLDALSVETRLSTARYAYPDWGSGRIVLAELADPQHQRQSLEAGLYLNIPFESVF